MKSYFETYTPRYRLSPAVRERERVAARESHKTHGRFTIHGITMDQFHAMLESQGELCAICREFMARPCIDHSHIMRKVRGLLCFHCNTALGHFRDDVKRLRAAIAYVEAS